MKNTCYSTRYNPLATEEKCLGKAPPKKSEVELLCQSVTILQKAVDELSCGLEPILMRPGPCEKEEMPIEQSTSPLMEHVRDSRTAIDREVAKIQDITRRIKF